MISRLVSICALLLFLPLAPAQDALDVALSDLLRAAPGAEARATAVKAVLAAKPTRADLLRRLRAGVFPAPADGLAPGWTVREARDEAGERYPYQLFLPESLMEPETPLPLLVHLHGSVARADFSREPGDTGYGRRLWVEMAGERGFVLVCPLGKRGREWWTPIGVRAVHAILRDLQRLLPIDDDRIVATGFSDGASGCFHLAMTAPERFAAFVPMNGHPEVAASASGRELFPSNLAATPMWAMMTRDDALYPSSAVLPHFQPALAMGAPLRLLSWENGNHRPAYFEATRAMIGDFIVGARREAAPARRLWRFDGPGQHGDIEVVGLGGTSASAEQVMSGPGRIRLGIEQAEGDAGPGFLVSRVTPGGTAAALGVKVGDRLLSVNGVALESPFSLFQAFAGVAHGDPVTAALRRGEERIALRGRIPAHVPRPTYRRGAAIGEIDLRRGDEGVALDTRGIDRLTWRWSGNEAPPTSIRLNGAERKLSWKEIPLVEILDGFAREGDRARVATHVTTLPF